MCFCVVIVLLSLCGLCDFFFLHSRCFFSLMPLGVFFFFSTVVCFYPKHVCFLLEYAINKHYRISSHIGVCPPRATVYKQNRLRLSVGHVTRFGTSPHMTFFMVYFRDILPKLRCRYRSIARESLFFRYIGLCFFFQVAIKNAGMFFIVKRFVC